MRFVLCVLTACSISSVLAYSAGVRAQAHSAQVVTDDATGTIRFVIDGKEVGRFSEAGFSVRNDITYGGLMIDHGPAGYDREAAP